MLALRPLSGAVRPTKVSLLPSRVLSTLELGRPVAARLRSTPKDGGAWLHVRPIVDPSRTWDSLRDCWALQRQTSQPFRAPTAFVVRYLALSRVHIEADERGDLDLALRAHPAEDWQVVVPDLASLEKVLALHLRDFETVRLPADVDYPEPPPEFAKARSLDDVLGAA